MCEICVMVVTHPVFAHTLHAPLPGRFLVQKKFQTELADNPHTEGFLAYPDEWIATHKADIIIAMFGFDESFQGPAGVENYKAELEAFIKHTLTKNTMAVPHPS